MLGVIIYLYLLFFKKNSLPDLLESLAGIGTWCSPGSSSVWGHHRTVRWTSGACWCVGNWSSLSGNGSPSKRLGGAKYGIWLSCRKRCSSWVWDYLWRYGRYHTLHRLYCGVGCFRMSSYSFPADSDWNDETRGGGPDWRAARSCSLRQRSFFCICLYFTALLFFLFNLVLFLDFQVYFPNFFFNFGFSFLQGSHAGLKVLKGLAFSRP